MGLPASDWSNYEALLPRPSYSAAGVGFSSRGTTIPQVRTYLRQEAYDRTVTRDVQRSRSHALSRPLPHKLVNSRGEGVVNRKLQEKSIAVSKARGAEHKFPALSQVSLPVPKAFKRPALARTSVSLNAGRDDEDETYSETPMHVRAAQALVFDLPRFVRTERATITSGRIFTWGGRYKMELPKYDPHRAQALAASSHRGF